MSRTNEEIIEEWVANDKGRSIQECIDRMCRLCEAARSEEREKQAKAVATYLEDLVECRKQCPLEGSGPWAIMQHWAGKNLRYCESPILTWKAGTQPSDDIRIYLSKMFGWSIVPDEPKAMVFCEGDIVFHAGKNYELQGGQWLPS